MKKYLLLTTIIFISTVCFSQDLISLRRGERVEAIVTEVTPTLVRYKLFSNPEGKVYFVYKADVSGIMYKNGKVENFNQSDEQPIENNSNDYQRQPNRNIYNSSQGTSSIVLNRNNYQDVVYLRNGSMIRGTIIEQVPNQSIKIETNDGNIFSYQMNAIERITKEPTKRDHYTNSAIGSTLGFQPGYKGIIELGMYYFGAGGVNTGQINFHFINGYQVNPYFSLGIGVGADIYFGTGGSAEVLVPLFADFRAGFVDSAVSPYFSLDIGYSFDASNSFTGVGLMLNPTIGISYKTSERNEIHIGVGYQMQTLSSYGSSVNFGAIVAKVGVSF